MLKLILVRHGETDSNQSKAYLGWTDVELNAVGRQQALNAEVKLKDQQVDGIFTSPLKRAYRTAEIINKSIGCSLSAAEELKEMNFGVWDNLTREEICSADPKEWNAWSNDWVGYKIRDGESAQEAFIRNIAFLEDFLEKNESGTFVMVTHLGVIRNLLAHLLCGGVEHCWRFKVGHGSITTLEIVQGYAVLTGLNL